MNKYISYIWKIIRHKYHVYKIGRKLKTPILRLIKHDLSKFYPSEFFPYVEEYYGNTLLQKDHDMITSNYERAWDLHIERNDHHWQHWVPKSVNSKEILERNLPEIPICVLREMVADWVAASVVYRGVYPKLNDWPWFYREFPTIIMNNKSKSILEHIIYKEIFEVEYDCGCS